MKIIKQTSLQLLKRIWYQKHFSIIDRKIGIIKITKQAKKSDFQTNTHAYYILFQTIKSTGDSQFY